MKKVSLPLLLIISFSLFAQDDDYCPCQEVQAQEAEMFEYFTSINNQIEIFMPQENAIPLIPEVVEIPEPITIIFPKEEEKKPEIIENDLSEEEPEEISEKISSRIDARKSKMKKFKKHKKHKIKRKKKARKYKGRCPFF